MKFQAWDWVYTDGEPLKNSYGINNSVYRKPAKDTDDRMWSGPVGVSKRNWQKMTSVKSPYSVPMFLECYRWGGGARFRSTPGPRFEPTTRDQVKNDALGSWARFTVNRHGGYVNTCFMDGSVKKISLKGLWDLKWHREYDTHEKPSPWPEWMSEFRE